MQERPISIDVFVVHIEKSEHHDPNRSSLNHDARFVVEFAIFGEMQPLQLRVQSTAEIKLEESIVMDSSLSLEGFDPSVIDADYRPFFDSIS